LENHLVSFVLSHYLVSNRERLESIKENVKYLKSNEDKFMKNHGMNYKK